MLLISIVAEAAEQAVEHAASPGVVETLGINWKLFLAQAVNFGIVVFVLWKWVFRPVAGTLETRRQKIEQSVKRAEELEQRMSAFEIEREQKLQAARTEADALIGKAQAAASAAREDSVRTARTEAEKIVTTARSQIEAEKDQMLKEVREELAELTVLATEKILRAKIDKEKDKKLIEEAVKNF